MTFHLALLATAAAGAIAFGVSLAVFVVGRVSSRAIDALSPAAQVRLLLCQALLPLLSTVVLMTAAMAPAFGWIADHCGGAEDLHHGHPHLCTDHQVMGLPAVSVLVLAALFWARLLLGTALVLKRVWVTVVAQNALHRASSWDAGASVRVVPLAEPQAFVVGVASPTVYVTRGLLAGEHREHLAAVLAHEQAHVLRADPLKRLLCQLGLIVHLPGIARSLDRHLGRAQEMAADADAAARIGSRERIALALVRLTRARWRRSQLVLAFGTGDLESRVRRLLLPPKGYDFPTPAALFVAGVALVALVALSADGVHHGVEMLLGLFGS